MRSVHVEHEYPLPVWEVFQRLSDHERFLSGNGLVCRVVVPGDGERNGLNAVREVRSGGVFFRERITAFAPPTGFAYHIEKLRLFGLPLGFHHEGGDLAISATERGAKVVWRSRFEIRLPLIGDVICAQFARTITRKFESLLRRADRGE